MLLPPVIRKLRSMNYELMPRTEGVIIVKTWQTVEELQK